MPAFVLTRTAAPMMKARGYGRVINMTSIAAYRAAAEDTAYITAKGALTALTRAQASQLGQWGITVNAISPGAFATETNQALSTSPQGQELIKSRSCLARWGAPHEITGAAVFLASPSASYVTGQVLIVDGGVMARY
jgi:gluconate 5-dehydrogenase